MKKSYVLSSLFLALALLSNNANAGLFCGLVKIDNYTGSCYFDGYAPIQHNESKKYALAKKGNQIIIPAQYDNSAGLSNGLWAVAFNGKWGMVDVNNQAIIPFEYEQLNPPNKQGIIRAKKNGQWGFMDKNENTLIPFGQYDYVEVFADDKFARVQKNGKWGYLNHHLEQITPLVYDRPVQFRFGLACTSKEHKHGCINEQGVEIIPFIYDKIDAFMVGKHQKQVVAYLNGEVVYFDKRGRKLK